MFTYQDQTAVSTRELAWNLAGHSERFIDSGVDVEKALAEADLLDWNVRKDEKPVRNERGVEFPGKFGISRDSAKGEIGLGVAGSRFEIYQNDELVEFLDTIVGEGGAEVAAAGYFGEGQKVFAVMKMPQSILVDGQDSTDMYLCAMNAHNGTASLTAWLTALRPICTNMLTPSLKSAKQRWSIRHTSSLRGKVQQARESLRLSWTWQETMEREFTKLLETPFSAKQFETVVDQVEPQSDSELAGWVERQQAKRDQLHWLFNESPTNEIGRGTKWGAYNAFTEFYDWYLPTKGADPEGTDRAKRLMDSTSLVADKQAAFVAVALAR